MDPAKLEAALSGKKKSRLSAKVEAMLNKQILVEFNASQLYQAMAVWCEYTGYTGAAAFLFKHVGEERVHMDKLYGYMLERNAQPKVPAIAAQPSVFSGLKSILEKGLEHEIYVTGTYIKAHKEACSEQDMLTEEFLRFYFKEQAEEEAIYLGLLVRLEVIGNDKKGLFFLDKEIGELV